MPAASYRLAELGGVARPRGRPSAQTTPRCRLEQGEHGSARLAQEPSPFQQIRRVVRPFGCQTGYDKAPVVVSLYMHVHEVEFLRLPRVSVLCFVVPLRFGPRCIPPGGNLNSRYGGDAAAMVGMGLCLLRSGGRSWQCQLHDQHEACAHAVGVGLRSNHPGAGTSHANASVSLRRRLIEGSSGEEGIEAAADALYAQCGANNEAPA